MPIINIVYILLSLIIISLIYSGYDFGFILFFYVLINLNIAYQFLRSFKFYSLLLHLSITVLVIYIWNVNENRNNVYLTPTFDFSVFTDKYLKQAMIVVLFSGITIRVPHILKADRLSSTSYDFKQRFRDMANYIGGRNVIYYNILLFVSILLAVILFLTNASLLEYPYPSHNIHQWVNTDVFKLPTFISLLALLQTYAWVFTSNRRSMYRTAFARVCFILVSYYMFLLTGNRGFITFLLFFAAAIESYLYYMTRKGILWPIIFVLSAMFYFEAGPYLRANLSISSTKNPLALALNYIQSPAESRQFLEGTYDLESLPLLGQNLFHLLYTIDLIEKGISLKGSTFINLVPQFLPQYLDGILWERPINDNWLLNDQYKHEGGFLHLANAYWNGGLFVCLLYCLILSYLLKKIDAHLNLNKSSTLFLATYIFYIPSLIVQMGYGIQGIARIIEVLFIIIIIDGFIYNRKNISL
jgi:hypothetical protein